MGLHWSGLLAGATVLFGIAGSFFNLTAQLSHSSSTPQLANHRTQLPLVLCHRGSGRMEANV